MAGQYSGKLSNSGEKIRLKDLQTGVLAEFEYRDDWYAATDGQGRSLVLVDPYHVTSGQLGQKTSWRASYRWGGSPGAAIPALSSEGEQQQESYRMKVEMVEAQRQP